MLSTDINVALDVMDLQAVTAVTRRNLMKAVKYQDILGKIFNKEVLPLVLAGCLWKLLK